MSYSNALKAISSAKFIKKVKSLINGASPKAHKEMRDYLKYGKNKTQKDTLVRLRQIETKYQKERKRKMTASGQKYSSPFAQDLTRDK